MRMACNNIFNSKRELLIIVYYCKSFICICLYLIYINEIHA